MSERLGEKVSNRRAWKTADLDQYPGWKVTLSNKEYQQLELAAKSLPAATKDWLVITKQDLQAPELVSRMAAIAEEIHMGYGFAKINGLDISQYSENMLHRIYWVIAICLGQVVSQNAKGEMIGTVTDLIGGAERGTDDRGYTSSDELRFHCDGGGVSALFCIRQAPTGGSNAVVSLLSIYNEILTHHPEHLETLYRGFPLYQRKEAGDGRDKGKVTERRIPTLTEKDGHITAWLNLKLAELASEVSNSEYSDGELAALKIVEEIAEREDFKFSFRLNPGDMIIFNNFSMMHKRSKFTDDPDPTKKRLMLRLWLNLHRAALPVPGVAKLSVGFKHASPVIVAD